MDVFPIHPAPSRTIWLLIGICTLTAIIASALAYTAWWSRHARVELTPGGVRLVGDFWGRTIPYAAIDAAGARVVDATANAAHAPRRRTFGTGLPGYASGWFRLRNGEKALLYLTRRDRVVYVPTRAGHALLLSVDEPERFVERLSFAGGTGPAS